MILFMVLLRTMTMHSRRFVAYPLPFAMLRTWTALATLRTRTTLAALRTLATLTAGRTLHVALGLVDEHTMRELVFTGLRVNLKELHADLVAFLDASLLDGLQTLPVNL